MSATAPITSTGADLIRWLAAGSDRTRPIDRDYGLLHRSLGRVDCRNCRLAASTAAIRRWQSWPSASRHASAPVATLQSP